MKGNGMVYGAIATVVIVVILAKVVVALWPTFVGTDTDVQALNGTDTATVTFKAVYPIALLVIGLGIVAGIIFWALKKFRFG